MSKKLLVRGVALACVLTFVAAACGDDGGKKATDATTAGGSTAATTGGSSGSSAATTAPPAKSSGLLKSDGPCKDSLPPYPVGIITVFESPVLTLIDQVSALTASVKAFNARGGIAGHCMKLTTCDDKADPNKEVDCARQFINNGIVATLNDTTSFNPDAIVPLFEAAGLPRIGVSPGVPELKSKVSYPIGLGGTGTTFAMVPACAHAGFKKIAAIHVDTPQVVPLFAALAGMLKAYGATIVAKIPVTAGTTDYQQFILKAQSAGADCVIIPLGGNEAIQVLNAAKELNSKLVFSGSLGTFGLGDVQKFGKFGEQLLLNAELPPVTADPTTWPILPDVIADLSASGDPQLQRLTIKSSPVRSWVAVYHLKTIVEKFGTPDTITREAITAAFQKAKDVDTFGMIPPWTPTDYSKIPNFSAVSQPWYYQIKYDDTAKNFVVLPDKLNVVNELIGQITYPQPAK